MLHRKCQNAVKTGENSTDAILVGREEIRLFGQNVHHWSCFSLFSPFIFLYFTCIFPVWSCISLIFLLYFLYCKALFAVGGMQIIVNIWIFLVGQFNSFQFRACPSPCNFVFIYSFCIYVDMFLFEKILLLKKVLEKVEVDKCR